jgi:hypothetical protein
VVVCCSNYEGMLARLNISALNSKRRHLYALFLINVFECIISCDSIFDTVIILKPARIIRDCPIFMVNHNLKVSAQARGVSAANAVCRDIRIFNKDRITLTDLLYHCL